jgi:hypothetical protein
MRSLIILLLFTCFFNVAIAQLSDDEKAVIHVAAGPGHHLHDFCYEDANIPPFIVDMASNVIETDTTLNLSASEIIEAVDKLHAAEYAQNWQASRLDSAVVVKESDFKQTGTNNLQEYVEKKYPNLQYVSYQRCSIPIFIRNNTVCFIYSATFLPCFTDPANPKSKVCSSSEGINMYVKRNNKWYKTRSRIFVVYYD